MNTPPYTTSHRLHITIQGIVQGVGFRPFIYTQAHVQLRAVADRVNDAQRNGVDAQGLTLEQLNDMLFKDRYINGKRTFGIVTALLSGIASNTREGEVGRCIIEYATMFDIPYGPGGANGQVDVGTRRVIIEAKVDSVSSGAVGQIETTLTGDLINPPDANGIRKAVILYAPVVT